MYWSGDHLCRQRCKPLFILEQITMRVWNYTGTQTSRNFRICSILHKDWFWTIKPKFWMYAPSWTRSTLTHDQVIKWTKAKVHVNSDSVLCLGKMQEHSTANQRWKAQLEELRQSNSYRELFGIGGEPIWVRVEFFAGRTSLEILQKIQKDLQKSKHSTWRFLKDKSSSCKCLMTRKFRKMHFEFRTSRELREEIPARTLVILRPRRRTKWHGTLSYTLEGKWDSIAAEMMGLFLRKWTPSIRVHQCFESWNSEKGKWQMYHTLECGFIEHKTLFRTIHSANQLSIYGAVSCWCEEFAQRTLNQKESTMEQFAAKANEQLLKNCETARMEFFGANSMVRQSGIWKQIATMSSEFWNTGERCPIYESLWRCDIREKSLYWDELQHHSWRRWWFLRPKPSMQKIHIPAKIQIPEFMQWSHDKLKMDRFFKFISYDILTSAELKFRFLPRRRNIGLPGWCYADGKTATWRRDVPVIQTTIPQVLNCCWKDLLQEKENFVPQRRSILGHRGNSCEAVEKSDESSVQIFRNKFFLLKKGSGMTFLLVVSSEDIPLKPKSQNWPRDWDVDMMKTKRKQTALFSGIRWVQNYDKHLTRTEGKKFPDSDWLQHIFEGSNKMRFQYLHEFQRCLTVHSCYSRTRAGGNLTAPEFGGSRRNSAQRERMPWGCSYDATSILKSGLFAGGGESKEGQTIFFTPLKPFGDIPDEEEPRDDLSKPIKAHYHSKSRQDAVYWIILARAQDKGLQFWQTRSHAVIICGSVPAYCIYKVISQKGKRTFFERLSTPRPAQKIVLKSAWQSHQQQQQQQDTSEGVASGTTKRGTR